MITNLDKCLETICAIYIETKQVLLAKIIVNAVPDIISDYDVDSECPIFKIKLSIPKELYLTCLSEIKVFEEKILRDLNDYFQSSTGDVVSVTIMMLPNDNGDWREQSGLLLSENPVVSPSVEQRLWGDSPVHVFFSYSSSNLDLIHSIKEKLSALGISPFVSEEDIQPSESWASALRSALSSMHVMVVFLTKDYHQSIWTNQEIGFAISRKITIIPVDLGAKPEGFLTEFQCLSCDTEKIAEKLFSKFISMYPDSYNTLSLNRAVYNLEHARNYEAANNAAYDLYHHKDLSDDMVSRVINAYNSNNQVRDAFQIMNTEENSLPRLVSYLQEVTGREYHIHHGILSIKE